jgi:hypothetical protein
MDLTEAARSGDLVKLQRAIDSKVDVNAFDQQFEIIRMATQQCSALSTPIASKQWNCCSAHVPIQIQEHAPRRYGVALRC